MTKKKKKEKDKYIEMQEDLHQRVLDLRSIENILERASVKRMWDDSTKEERDDLMESIIEADKDGVIKWIKNHRTVDLGEMCMTQLIRQGQKYHIKNYSRLCKVDLIDAIEECRNDEAREDSGDARDGASDALPVGEGVS